MASSIEGTYRQTIELNLKADTLLELEALVFQLLSDTRKQLDNLWSADGTETVREVYMERERNPAYRIHDDD